MHHRAARAQTHNLQSTCCKTLQFQRWSSAQEAPLRLRSCIQREEQGMPESSNHQPPHSDWASPQAADQRERHKSIILLAPPDHKRNPVPLYGTMLSARAQRSHKHSKKACVLSVSLTWAQTGRTQEILSHSQCWSSNDGCPHKGKPSPGLKLQPRACPAPVQHLESLDSQQEIPTPTNSYTRQHSSTTPSSALGLS